MLESHLPIRDAAYDALPKAKLHARFAEWLDDRAGDPIEADEIIGYYLEQAHRFRVELGSSNVMKSTRSSGIVVSVSLDHRQRLPPRYHR